VGPHRLCIPCHSMAAYYPECNLGQMLEGRQAQHKKRSVSTIKHVRKEREIVSYPTFAVNPALKLECVRVRVDFWISSDGPGVVAALDSQIER